jgi:glutathione S-transferase
MITLYHSPFTRSHLIRFALEELGLPHELRRIDATKGEHKSPEYLRINPLGQLPALVDGDVVIREAAAIALHLADKATDKGLAPKLGTPERAVYYQWVVFSVATELFALSKIAMHTRFLPEPMRVPAIAEDGRAQWSQIAPVLSQAVTGKRFLLGDSFSMADVLVGGSLWLATMIDAVAPYPELVAYYGRVTDRPAFQRAFSDAVGP